LNRKSKRIIEKANLFNRKSETSDNNSKKKEKKKSDPEGRSPGKSHGESPTPRTTLFVVVV